MHLATSAPMIREDVVRAMLWSTYAPRGDLVRSEPVTLGYWRRPVCKIGRWFFWSVK